MGFGFNLTRLPVPNDGNKGVEALGRNQSSSVPIIEGAERLGDDQSGSMAENEDAETQEHDERPVLVLLLEFHHHRPNDSGKESGLRELSRCEEQRVPERSQGDCKGAPTDGANYNGPKNQGRG